MAKNQYQLVTFFLNGKEVERMIDVRASLTDMLRNDFSMTSVKKGCEVGECGACNVLIDGECYNSCLYLAVWAEGKPFFTLVRLKSLRSISVRDARTSTICSTSLPLMVQVTS